MFKPLGALVALYALWAAIDGKVYAKQGGLRTGWRVIARAEEPVYFWTVVGIYGALGIAMMTVF